MSMNPLISFHISVIASNKINLLGIAFLIAIVSKANTFPLARRRVMYNLNDPCQGDH
jgi:hypothetical protein